MANPIANLMCIPGSGFSKQNLILHGFPEMRSKASEEVYPSEAQPQTIAGKGTRFSVNKEPAV
jgi:hypothetical protein